MNDPTLTPDDPKLTAYALGELSGDERAHIEAALRENPALRATVEEIRATAAQIEAALAAEASGEIDVSESLAKTSPALNGHAFAGESSESDEPDEYRGPVRDRKILQFPQLYLILATAAAACFALFVKVKDDEYATKQQAEETIARIARKKHFVADARPTPSTVVVALAPTPRPETETAATPPAVEPSQPPVIEVRPAAPKAADAERANVVAISDAPPVPVSPQPENKENKLALLEITKLDPLVAKDQSAAPPVKFGVAPVISAVPENSISGTIGARSSKAATKNSSPPSIVPKPSGVGGGAPPPTVIALSGVSMASNFTAPASPPAQPTDEIVRLDAFEVSADRVGSFLGSAAFNNFTTVTRGMIEHEPLPRPPLGARFSRGRDPAAPDNDFTRAADTPTSQFSVDVDTASYANIRRLIESGQRPPRETVRIEELVNYFPYDYPAPKNDQAFAASLEVASAPWAPEHRLVRIGLKAREIATAQRGPANLVFLIDVSASMGEQNKLPLVREALRLLVDKLRPDDRVAIVTYAANSVMALPATPVSRASEILAALNTLKPASIADGASGLQLAYNVAVANFAKNGMNRVLLCTDGAFNTGASSEAELLSLIDEKAKTGISLTMLGFGPANEHSTPLERLARKSGAVYGYIDSRREAEKLIVDQVASSLALIARDVKVQVAFNPTKVLAYRLIGYENRPLRREDYGEGSGSVGEIGAGQTVTALYEIVPILPADIAAARAKGAKSADFVRYGASGVVSSRFEMPETEKPPGDELLTVKLGYKNPNTVIGWSRTQEFMVKDTGAEFASASADFRFAAAVAEFGMILRGSPHKGKGTLQDVAAWANTAAGPKEDSRGYRRDFIALVHRAASLVK